MLGVAAAFLLAVLPPFAPGLAVRRAALASFIRLAVLPPFARNPGRAPPLFVVLAMAAASAGDRVGRRLPAHRRRA